MIRRLIYRRHVHVLRLLTVRLCMSPLRLVLRAIPLSLELFLVEVDVVLLDVDDRLSQEGVRFPNEGRRDLTGSEINGLWVHFVHNTHLRRAVGTGDRLTQSNHTFKLTDSDTVRIPASTRRVVLSKNAVFLHQDIGSLRCEL